MAETMNDAVSRLLPPQILSVDVVLMHKENGSAAVYKNVLNGTDLNLKPTLFFPSEFPYEFDSALSSPVDSVLEFTETKATSDEEEFLAGLTQRLTHSSTRKLEKSWVVAGSPGSTLSGLRSMSVSSNGSPNGSSSLVSSPPMTPSGDQNDTWELISAAAGQIARLKMSNCTEIVPKYTGSLLPPPKSTITSPAHVIKNPSLGLYTSQSVNFDFVANTNQQYVKQEQMLKAQREHVVRPAWASSQPQQIQNRGGNFGYEIESARCGQQLPWPPLQVRHHQRPVFVAGFGCVKRECAGTGVFLPRTRRDGLNNNNPPDSRRNSAFPSVLVPHVQQRFHSSFVPNYDAIIARRNALITLQKRNLRAAARNHHEIHLPKEWTYY